MLARLRAWWEGVRLRYARRHPRRSLPAGYQYVGRDGRQAARRRQAQGVQKTAKDILRLKAECDELRRQAAIERSKRNTGQA